MLSILRGNLGQMGWKKRMWNLVFMQQVDTRIDVGSACGKVTEDGVRG